MSSIIRTNIENLEEPIVILRADTSVKHGLIVNLLDELRKIENLKIGISTEKQLSGL
jgi:biopolymer transport protein ExbD